MLYLEYRVLYDKETESVSLFFLTKVSAFFGVSNVIPLPIVVSNLSEVARASLNRELVKGGYATDGYDRPRTRSRVDITCLSKAKALEVYKIMRRSVIFREGKEDDGYRPNAYERRFNYSRCTCGLECALMGHKHHIASGGGYG